MIDTDDPLDLGRLERLADLRPASEGAATPQPRHTPRRRRTRVDRVPEIKDPTTIAGERLFMAAKAVGARTEWETKFLGSIQPWLSERRDLTENQRVILAQIAARIVLFPPSRGRDERVLRTGPHRCQQHRVAGAASGGLCPRDQPRLTLDFRKRCSPRARSRRR